MRRRKHLLTAFVLIVFAGIGSYLAFFADARSQYSYNFKVFFMYGDPEPRTPGYQPDYDNPSGETVQNQVDVGDIILPPMTIHPVSSSTPIGALGKFSVITAFYYPSSYVKLDKVYCEATTRCKIIPKVDIGYNHDAASSGSQPDRSLTYYDRSFFVCSDRPNRNPNKLLTDSESRILFAPKFIVTNNSDAFPIYASTRVYANGACDVNNGVTNEPRHPDGDGNCFNRKANLRPGSDANGFPLQCGMGVKDGGSPGVDTPGVSGGIGNKPSTTTGQRAGRMDTGRNGSVGGGSSATHQGDSPSPIPSSSTQGDRNNIELEPSPFFDGKEYEKGSSTDTIASTARTTSKKLISSWPIVLGVLLLGGVTGAAYWKWRKMSGR